MRIQNKLFTIFFVTSIVLVTAQILIMQWSIGKGMIDYVNKKEIEALGSLVLSLEEAYQTNGSWQFLSGNGRLFRKIIDQHIYDETADSPITARSGQQRMPRGRRPFEEGRRGDRPPPPHRPQLPPPRDEVFKLDTAYAVLDKNKGIVAGIYPNKLTFEYIEIIVAEERVGFLAVSRLNKLTEGYELNFVEQQQRYVLLIALGLITIAMLVAFPLARHFVQPIKKLTSSMSKLTSGQYEQRITLKRKDEFAQLSRDFNELAATLEQNEQARRRWLADISHELRTPVAVLKGELESILDGVRPLSLERIKSSNEEVKHLEQLLNDLHELTRNDLGTMHYRKDWVKLIALIQEEVNNFQASLLESGLRIEFSAPTENVEIYADATRLKQLFSNLFSNVGKYAVDGNLLNIDIRIIEGNAKKEVHVYFEDNGQGVDESNLQHLFEHLFRVENSRNRDTGGSGLGLSICKKIVEAHHGTISAFVSKFGGLGIQIILPME